MPELSELRLKNFKSFRKARIPFKQGFTAVIGPNGSGKSNILDAIMFVLGSTSMKSLRAGRIAKLINNTTNENYGKVEMTIKDNEKLWKISRSIDKKGKSVCRINDQKKGLNEIVSLLAELGLKSEGNNIVAQGDITRIIEMNPEQRRQIIDELAGIREFDLKKEEAEKNLGKANERVKDITLVLNERMSRIEALEEERKAAEEFFKLTEMKNRAKSTILRTETDEMKKKQAENGEKLQKLKDEADALDKKAKATDEAIAESTKKAQEKERVLFEKQETEYRESLSKIETLKGQINLSSEKKSNAERKIADNSERESVLSERMTELKKQLLEEKERLEQIVKEQPELETALKRVEKELGSGDEEKKQEILEETDRELVKIEGETDEKQSVVAQLHSEKTAAEKHNAITENELLDLSARINLLKQAKEKLDKLLPRLHVLEAKKLNELLEKNSRNIENTLEQEKEFKAEASEIQKAISELKKEIAACPICDSQLPAAKKKQVLEKKLAGEKKALFDAQKREKELRELKGIREGFESELELMHELRNETSVLKEKTSRLKELLEKKDELAKGNINVGEINSKIMKSEKELSELKEKRTKLNGKLSSIKTNRKTIELNKNKSELESKIELIKSEEANIREKLLSRIEEEKANAIKEIDRLNAENKENQFGKESIEKELAEAEKKRTALEEESGKLGKALESGRKQKEDLDKKLESLREKKESLESNSKKKSREMEEIRIENGKFEVRIADLQEEFAQFKQFKPLKNLSLKELKAEFAEAEKKLEKIGAVNLKAADSLKGERTELFEVKEKLSKVEEERSAVLGMIEKIEFKRKNVFMECFDKVKANFSKMFYEFFDGQGYLSLTEEDRPTESGLIIEAKHKGENLQSIDSMSGGEKTLTALAFIFSIQQYDPAPFYVFDEADAALDEANSDRLTRMITEVSRGSQFIAITHNNSLIKSAGRIVGVTLDKNKSSVVGLNLREQILEKNSGKELN